MKSIGLQMRPTKSEIDKYFSKPRSIFCKKGHRYTGLTSSFKIHPDTNTVSRTCAICRANIRKSKKIPRIKRTATHCIHGHKYNLRTMRVVINRGCKEIRCRICENNYARAKYRAKKLNETPQNPKYQPATSSD